MGIPIGQKTVNLELRYAAVEVQKNLSTGEVSVTIPYQVGFFDDNNSWVIEKADVINASGDAALVLFGIKPTDIGGTENSPMGELINTLAYAIVSNQIPLTAIININSVASSDSSVAPPSSVQVTVKKEATGAIVGSFTLNIGSDSPPIPVVIGADITISAQGFEPTHVKAPLLQGHFPIAAVTLTPKQNSEGNEGDSVPNVDGNLDPTEESGSGTGN